MKISCTGHRDKLANQEDLIRLLKSFQNVELVIHGGAIGFDSQVNEIAGNLQLPVKVIRPEYNRFGKQAPLVRNREIVKSGDVLIALYDGRKTGGTMFTIAEASKQNKQVFTLQPEHLHTDNQPERQSLLEIASKPQESLQ